MNYSEEIGNINAENWSAWEKLECYGDVANRFQRIFTLIQNNIFWVLLTVMTRHIEKSENYYFEWK